MVRGRRVDRGRLRALVDTHRGRLGWTMAQFAEQAELAPATVYYAVSPYGRREPSLLTTSKLARVLDCDIDDFTVADPPGQQMLDLSLTRTA